MPSPKTCRLFAALASLGLAVSWGCNTRPDPEKYGEIVTELPPRLEKPFPLPQLEEPKEAEEVAK